MEQNLGEDFLQERFSDEMRNSEGRYSNLFLTEADREVIIDMGFEKKLVNKVVQFLNPRTIDRAVQYLSIENDVYQHPFYLARGNERKCYICGLPPENHFDYNGRKRPSNLSSKLSSGLTWKERTTPENGSVHQELQLEPKETATCLLCEEADDLKSLNCGHLFCRDCWFHYFEQKITEAVTDILCMENDCSEKAPENFILEILAENKDLLSKFQRYKKNQEIMNDPNSKFCPIKGCDSYGTRKDASEKYIKCKKGHKFCFVCLKGWHGDEGCDKEIEKDFQLWKKDKVVKRCPNCEMWTEKNEGCNHMTCVSCKFQWCWLCEKKYTDRHFQFGTCQGLQFEHINYLSERPARYRFSGGRNNQNDPLFGDEREEQGEYPLFNEVRPGCCNKISKYFLYLGYNLFFWICGWSFTLVLYFDYYFTEFWFPDKSECVFFFVTYFCSFTIGISLFLAYQVFFWVVWSVVFLFSLFCFPLTRYIYTTWCRLVIESDFYDFTPWGILFGGGD